MKKLLAATALGVVFLSVHMSVHAEWVRISGSDDTVIYVDPDKIKYLDSGKNLVSAWILFDNKKADYFSPLKKNFKSRIQKQEFKCREEQDRDLGGVLYAENMAKGEIIFTKISTSELSKWELSNIPGTVSSAIFNAVCNR